MEPGEGSPRWGSCIPVMRRGEEGWEQTRPRPSSGHSEGRGEAPGAGGAGVRAAEAAGVSWG